MNSVADRNEKPISQTDRFFCKLSLAKSKYGAYLSDQDKKLQKEARESTGNPNFKDYVGGMHYKDDGTGSGSKLEFFQHAEGRVVVNGSSFDYEYNLTGPRRLIT